MDVALLSLLGSVIALGLLMALTYRGWSLIWLAPALAALGVALSADARVLAHVTQIYMPALGGFVVSFFPLFVLGALNPTPPTPPSPSSNGTGCRRISSRESRGSPISSAPSTALRAIRKCW